MVEPDWPQMTKWRMRIAYWIPKATNTHSEYLILVPFPQQQWLHERTSVTLSVLSVFVLIPAIHIPKQCLQLVLNRFLFK
jgi:hypothetical protein